VVGNRPAAKARPAQPKRNCLVLLGSLVALLVSFPFLEDVAKPLVLIIPVAVVFVAAVVAVDAGRINIFRALFISGSQVSLAVVSLAQREEKAIYWIAVSLALLATAFLILFATYCVLGYVLRSQVITRDQIYAGICMYLMLGFAFGAVFYLINTLDPGSFAVSNDLLARSDNPDLMYFSFVTLATLGYGDITPRTNIARSLAVVEALAGMLYIAVFMARLVSLHSTSAEND
jgi:hypothetical protein